jgi:hypothetical protein
MDPRVVRRAWEKAMSTFILSINASITPTLGAFKRTLDRALALAAVVIVFAHPATAAVLFEDT